MLESLVEENKDHFRVMLHIETLVGLRVTLFFNSLNGYWHYLSLFYILDSIVTCGRRMVTQYPKEYLENLEHLKLVGGHPSIPGYHPWQVGIRLRKANGIEHHCGGAILSQFYIVSAAHCFP